MKLATCGGGQLRQRERNFVVLFNAFCFIFQSYKCNLRNRYIDKTATKEEEEEENTNSIYHSLCCFTKKILLCFGS